MAPLSHLKVFAVEQFTIFFLFCCPSVAVSHWLNTHLCLNPRNQSASEKTADGAHSPFSPLLSSKSTLTKWVSEWVSECVGKRQYRITALHYTSQVDSASAPLTKTGREETQWEGKRLCRCLSAPVCVLVWLAPLWPWHIISEWLCIERRAPEGPLWQSGHFGITGTDAVSGSQPAKPECRLLLLLCRWLCWTFCEALQISRAHKPEYGSRASSIRVASALPVNDGSSSIWHICTLSLSTSDNSYIWHMQIVRAHLII